MKKFISILAALSIVCTLLVPVTGYAATTNETLLYDDFQGTLDSTKWTYNFYKRSGKEESADPTDMVFSIETENNAKVEDDKRLRIKSATASKTDYLGGFYGKFSKKIPLVESLAGEDGYLAVDDNTKIVAEFTYRQRDSNTGKKVYMGFHNQANLTVETSGNSAPYGYMGYTGVEYSTGTSLKLSTMNSVSESAFFDATAVNGNGNKLDTKYSDGLFKIELTLKESGTFSPKYTVSYKSKTGTAWETTQPIAVGTDNDQKYLDCLFFHTAGSGIEFYIDDVTVQATGIPVPAPTEYALVKTSDKMVTVTSPENTTATLIVGAYNDSDLLVDVLELKTGLSLAEGANPVEGNYSLPGDATKLKIMLWNSLTNMTPFCADVTVPAE